MKTDPRAIAKLKLELLILSTREELCRLRGRKVAMRKREVAAQITARKGRRKN